MRVHNESSSSFESLYKLGLNYEEFDIVLADIDEGELEALGRGHEVEHLSAATFSSSPFPAFGRIHGINMRYMIPLVCQRAGNPQSNAINIWFLVDPGSPFTCLSLKSLEALLGQGNATNPFYSMAIQDQNSRIECHVSKGHYQEANILGANAMRSLKLSIVVDWDNATFKLVRL